MKKRIGAYAAATFSAGLLVTGLGATGAAAHTGTFVANSNALVSCQAAMDEAYAAYTPAHQITNYQGCTETHGSWQGSFTYYHAGGPI